MRQVSAVALETGLTLSYAEQGSRSGPVLCLLPGPTDSWRSYEPVLDRLPPSMRSIAVSQRGHGDSEKPASGYRVEDFAADVVALLDALGIERAVLVGAFRLVRSFLVGSSSEEMGPEVVDRLVEESVKVPARVWRETFTGLLDYDDTAELWCIDAPTLLVWGDADALVPLEMQHQLADAIPGAELRVYPGVGHTPRWEQPLRLASDVAAFVGSSGSPPR